MMTSTELAAVRLFVLDDHPMVHEALRSLCATSDAVDLVGGATTARQAMERLAEAAPDVALIDVNLVDGDGISLARRIREEHPDVRCLMFTWHGDQEAMLAAVLAGACGYVLKQIDSADLAATIALAARGSLTINPVAVTALVDRCQAAVRQPAGHEGFARNGPTFSARELAVLADAVAGLTDSEIGARQRMSADTANRYVSLIFTKFRLCRTV